MYMKKNLAYQIIRDYQLIPGKLSRKILNSIINDVEISPQELPGYISINQLLSIKKQYQRKILELKDQKYSPRYLPFYYLIKEKYPNFIWYKDDRVSKDKILNIYSPRIKNLRPSLLSLLLQKVD